MLVRLGVVMLVVVVERGRPKQPVVLTDEEYEVLTGWARRHKTAQALAMRARIVLACAQGLSNSDVAAVKRVSYVGVIRCPA